MSRTKKVEDHVILEIILDVIIRLGATSFSLEDCLLRRICGSLVVNFKGQGGTQRSFCERVVLEA
jgi:hypothetical protein